MFLKLFLLSVILIGIGFAGIAIKMFVIEGGQFRKKCSSSIKDPKTGKHLSCAGGSCSSHSHLDTEIALSKKNPISRRNVRIMTEKADF